MSDTTCIESIHRMEYVKECELNSSIKQYQTAFQSMAQGQFEEAEKLMLVLFLEKNLGENLRPHVNRKLFYSLYYQGKWKRISELFQKEMPGITEDERKGSLPLAAAPDEIVPPLKEKTTVEIEKGIFFTLPRVKAEVNGKSYYFVVDTGAQFTLVTDEVARQSVLQIFPDSQFRLSGSGGGASASVGIIQDLKIGAVSIKNHPVFSVPKDTLAFKMIGIPVYRIDGIIGWPMLRRFGVEMNFRDYTITFSPPAKVSSANRNLFELAEGDPLVLPDANFKNSGFLAFDSGALNSFFNRESLDMKPSKQKIKQEEQHGLGGSKLERVGKVNLAKLNAGGAELEFKDKKIRFDKVICDYVPCSLQLGIDVMRGKSVFFDATAGIFRILP